jgi:hypothetical protein
MQIKFIRFLLAMAAGISVPAFSGIRPIPTERIFGISLMQTGGGWPYDRGALWLNAGTSFRLIGFPFFGNTRVTPPLIIQVDYSYSPHLAAGPYLGYFRVTYSESGSAARTRFSSYQFGARWLFHGADYLNDLFGLGIDARQFDLYAGLAAGVDIRTFSYETADKKDFIPDPDRRYYPRVSLIFGVKYLLKQRIGIFAEAGRGTFGAFNAGACFKLIEKKRK